jgi:hypothetical protein
MKPHIRIFTFLLVIAVFFWGILQISLFFYTLKLTKKGFIGNNVITHQDIYKMNLKDDPRENDYNINQLNVQEESYPWKAVPNFLIKYSMYNISLNKSYAVEADEVFALKWRFMSEEKIFPYYFNATEMAKWFPLEIAMNDLDTFLKKPKKRLPFFDQYMNTFAVFPYIDQLHFHGAIGLSHETFKPMFSPSITELEGNETAYKISDMIPIERDLVDDRYLVYF